VEVLVKSQEVGEAREKLTARSESTEDFRISFNPGYLIDGVTAVDTEHVVFRLNESLKPGLIVPGGDGENGDSTPAPGEEKDFLYLIMPMRDPYGE
jgi:DNA polymerase-3 subunit beta